MSCTMLAAQSVSLLRDMSLKSLPLFAVAGVACLGLRRASAAARHVLWLLVLAGLLFLPLCCVLLPPWSAPVLPAAHPRAVGIPAPAIPSEPQTIPASVATAPEAAGNAPLRGAADAPPAPALPAAEFSPPIPARPTITDVDAVCLIWLTGMSLVLGRTLLGLVAAFHLVRRCRPVTEGALVEAADAARRTYGLTRPVALRVGEVSVPMTCGVRRPVALLPRGASDWPAGRLRAVLLHEAAHVRRLDWATMLFARCVCALYWFHPLVWLAAGRLRAESEAACDDLVLACGVAAPDYAAHLLEIVRGLAARRQTLTGTVAMAHRPDVAGRLRTILDGHTPRHGVSRRGLAVATLAAISLLAPLAALRPVASASPVLKEPDRTPGKSALELSWGSLVIPSPTLPSDGSPWVATLPNSVRVRLLFVGAQDANYNIVACWTPDGQLQNSVSKATTQAPVPGSYCLDGDLTVPRALEKADGAIELGKVTDRYPPSYDILGLGDYGGNGTQEFTFPINFAAGQEQGAIRVNLAIGPKTTLISVSPREGGMRRLTTGEVVSVSPLWMHSYHFGNKADQSVTSLAVTVPSRFVSDIIGYNLNVIGQDGKPVPMAHGFGFGAPAVSGRTARLVYTCRTSELPLNRVKAFQFVVRPFYSVIFRNIALRPAASSASASPDPQSAKAAASQADSLANLRHIGLGLLEYAVDHHERFPDAAHWVDEIIPYVISPKLSGAARQQAIAALFHDPAAPAGPAWSYAYNRALSNLSLAKVDSPATTVMVFESTLGTRNASDGGQSVPTPGWHQGGTDYLFADGHAKWLGPGAAATSFSPTSVPTGSAPPPRRVLFVTESVDLTQRLGAMVQGTGGGAKWHFLGSPQSFDFSCDTTTLRITSVKAKVWRLHDAAGNSLFLTDNAPQPVIVLNRTQSPLTLVARPGSGTQSIVLPPHALMILNGIAGPLVVSGVSGQGVSYRVSTPKTSLPLTIIRSIPSKESVVAVGNETTNTDFDK